MDVNTASVLVKYYEDLKKDSDTNYPSELSFLKESSVDFEVSQLFEHILKNPSVETPFIMDVSEEEIINLINNEEETISVSAILTLIDLRVPQLGLASRV